jgi:hypothetical protein
LRKCSRCKREIDLGLDRRRSWCAECYADWERQRSRPHSRSNLQARLDAKVEHGPSCWEWMGAKTDTGYGSIGVEGKTCYAHRLAYERHFGPIPDGYSIDHLCRNRACVNPDHLEAVPQKVNIRRGLQGALKTHCAQGHPWTDEHIYNRPGSGKRMCGTCNRERSRARMTQ